MLKPEQEYWATTALEDGDCAVFASGSKKLIGVGATPVQSDNFVKMHNATVTEFRKVADISIHEHHRS